MNVTRRAGQENSCNARARALSGDGDSAAYSVANFAISALTCGDGAMN